MVISRRDEMINNNIGLVHSIAKRFVGRGVDYEDLFQSGCIGLIKAVDNFDETKGFQFSTYAVPVIMGEIKRLFRDGGAIKVSRSLKEKSIRAQSLRDRFVKRELREPTLCELSQAQGGVTQQAALRCPSPGTLHDGMIGQKQQHTTAPRWSSLTGWSDGVPFF